jgi:hypothetical protein
VASPSSYGLGVVRESALELSSVARLMVDVHNLLFFVVKIVGGKGGVCILGYAKLFWSGMQPGSAKIIGTNAFEYPFAYPKRMTDWGMYAKILPVT